MDLTNAALDSNHRTGIIVIAVSGLISGVVVVSLLGYLLWSAFGWRYNGPQNGFRSFLNTDAGRYLVSLLLAHLCHAIGYAVGLHWVVEGKVSSGTLCNFQAAFLQLGDMGTVFWVFGISLHTLMHLFLSQRPPSWVAPFITTFGWAVILLLPILGPTAIADKEHSFFDGGSGMWCWVSNAYPRTQILYFFVWAMVSLAGSIVCYTLVYLRTAGWVSGGRYAPAMPRHRGRKSRWACISAFGHESSEADTESGPKSSSGGTGQHAQPARPRVDPRQKIGSDVRKVARKLLLYPVSYAFLVIPLTISSLMNMVGGNAPHGLLVAATVIFALGGAVDAVLFIITRRSFIRNATSSSSRSRSRRAGATGAGGDTRRFDGITVTRHELTVFDIQTLESTASHAPHDGKPDVLESPVEEKDLEGSERPFGGFVPYAASPGDVDSDTESTKPRAL